MSWKVIEFLLEIADISLYNYLFWSIVLNTIGSIRKVYTPVNQIVLIKRPIFVSTRTKAMNVIIKAHTIKQIVAIFIYNCF